MSLEVGREFSDGFFRGSQLWFLSTEPAFRSLTLTRSSFRGLFDRLACVPRPCSEDSGGNSGTGFLKSWARRVIDGKD